MNDNEPESSASTDPETALLLANIDVALRSLTKLNGAASAQQSLAHLEGALHTYGSVKHLLPKLKLSAAQRLPVEEQLQRLRNEILARNSHPGP